MSESWPILCNKMSKFRCCAIALLRVFIGRLIPPPQLEAARPTALQKASYAPVDKILIKSVKCI